MGSQVTELLGVYGQGGLTVLLAVIIYLLVRFFWIELKKITDKHEEAYKSLVGQMFDVVNKNTQSSTHLASTIEGLKSFIEYREK